MAGVQLADVPWKIRFRLFDAPLRSTSWMVQRGLEGKDLVVNRIARGVACALRLLNGMSSLISEVD